MGANSSTVSMTRSYLGRSRRHLIHRTPRVLVCIFTVCPCVRRCWHTWLSSSTISHGDEVHANSRMSGVHAYHGRMCIRVLNNSNASLTRRGSDDTVY